MKYDNAEYVEKHDDTMAWVINVVVAIIVFLIVVCVVAGMVYSGLNNMPL